jgi:hypothetical protein
MEPERQQEQAEQRAAQRVEVQPQDRAAAPDLHHPGTQEEPRPGREIRPPQRAVQGPVQWPPLWGKHSTRMGCPDTRLCPATATPPVLSHQRWRTQLLSKCEIAIYKKEENLKGRIACIWG